MLCRRSWKCGKTLDLSKGGAKERLGCGQISGILLHNIVWLGGYFGIVPHADSTNSLPGFFLPIFPTGSDVFPHQIVPPPAAQKGAVSNLEFDPFPPGITSEPEFKFIPRQWA